MAGKPARRRWRRCVSAEVRVEPARPEDREAWENLVRHSGSGTLFHALDFLDYHPEGRFETRHLVLREGERLVGMLPAGVGRRADGKRVLRSPYGASVGGLVWLEGTSAERLSGWVRALVEYARAQGFGALEMRVGPPIYLDPPGQPLSFALLANGFQLIRSWLTHIIPLPSDPGAALSLCSKGKARDVRAGLRRGAVPREAGAADLPVFLDLLADTYQRHGTRPTHTSEEIGDLFQRLPGRVRLFLCEREGQPLAGVLAFTLNPRVVYTFYICQHSEAPADLNANAVLISFLTGRLAGEGFRYLDLGPSTFDDYRFNTGVAFFKEGMGGQAWCRDQWSLDLG